MDDRTSESSPEAQLLQAIADSDEKGFYSALEQRAAVNHDGGKPLQLAVEKENYLFMKELILRGADIAHAVVGLRKEQQGIKRTSCSDGWGTQYRYETQKDEDRFYQIDGSVYKLQTYEKTFVESISKIESLRLQQKLLDEMREIKKEITEAIHGKPMDKKPYLRAPGQEGGG